MFDCPVISGEAVHPFVFFEPVSAEQFVLYQQGVSCIQQCMFGWC